ncbi:MAG: acyl carrier protein [Bacteroidia bacterium]
METTDILNEVNTIFKRIFENDAIVINPETVADDIDEWDSLNHTIMIVEVETHFGVKFKLKEIMGFKNVGDMCRIVKIKLDEKKLNP